ncbi:MAG: type I-C CRISPR-associated protein Cas5 [Thermoguttaceae bacterium]|nr:type I-C CRISPR-associated protein Cas5 [Thermoguttaceae bacterium]
MPVHRNTVEFLVTGQWALFTDPITKIGGEKFTYSVPTYEALKGVLSSVYWKPTFIWVIDAVRVLKQIQTQSINFKPIKYAENKAPDLALYTYLKDVAYQVRAHFVWNLNRPDLLNDRNEYKHHNIAKRMIQRGGRRDVFLGTRECQADVEPCQFGEGDGDYDKIEEIALGFMFHGFTYGDEAVDSEQINRITARFWKPVMRRGVIEFCPPGACEYTRFIRYNSIKPFGEKWNNFQGLNEFENEEDV